MKIEDFLKDRFPNEKVEDYEFNDKFQVHYFDVVFKSFTYLNFGEELTLAHLDFYNRVACFKITDADLQKLQPKPKS